MSLSNLPALKTHPAIKPVGRTGLILALLAVFLYQPFPAFAMGRDSLRQAYACYKLGDAACAKANLDAAIRSSDLSPLDEINAHALRGGLFLDQRKFGQALKDYNTALDLASVHGHKDMKPVLLTKRGSCYRRQGNYKNALADYAAVIKLNPRSDRAYYYRANIYHVSGRYKKALANYNRALSIMRHHQYYYQRSKTYVKMGELEKAIRDMERAVSLRPKRRSYRARLKYLKMQRGS